MYCLICSAWAGDISDDTADSARMFPFAAISFMSMIAIIYVVFCAIQIVYLFMGKGSLPWGDDVFRLCKTGSSSCCS